MRALFSLIVASALFGFAAPSHAPIGRHATIAQAPSDDVAAPPLSTHALAPALDATPHLSFAFLVSPAPRLVAAAPATVPLYLRDRALLL